MIRRNRGRNAKVEAKKDVVKSKAISGKRAVALGAVVLTAFIMISPPKALGDETNNIIAAVSTIKEEKSDNTAKIYYQEAIEHRNKAHYWRHKRGAGHKYHRFTRPFSNSVEYEKSRKARWKSIASKERRLYVQRVKSQRRMAKANNNFDLALKLASRYYGVSYSWLHACAYSEGHIEGRRKPGGPIDPFIMNRQGSGAGGWMQFMESTFYGNLEGAKPIPRKYRKWTSKLGQAYVAAYMFKHGQSGQWAGSGCN